MLHDKESEFWCYLAGGKNARCSIVYIRIRFPCPATVLTISSWESMQRLRIKRTVKNQELVHFLAVRRNRIACISTLPKLNLTKLPLLKAGQLNTSPKVYLALPCDRELCWEVSQLCREYSQWKRDDIVIQNFLYFLLLLSQPTKLSGMPLVGI